MLDFKEGTLYPALHKLENEGMVESFDSVGIAGRGGATVLPGQHGNAGEGPRRVAAAFASGDDDFGRGVAMNWIGQLVECRNAASVERFFRADAKQDL